MGVNPVTFYTCLWECLATNVAVRLPAIIFILSHFDRHLPMKDQIFLMGNDVDLMVRGNFQGLGGENLPNFHKKY